MKFTKKVQIESTNIEDVICDKCGESQFKNSTYGKNYFKPFCNFWEQFGYDSKWFGDGATVEYDICEKCLYDFVLSFKNAVIK